MAQRDIVLFLKSKRDGGIDDFFSISQLYRVMLNGCVCVPTLRALRNQVRKLRDCGVLEVQDIGGWPCYIRYKEVKNE